MDNMLPTVSVSSAQQQRTDGRFVVPDDPIIMSPGSSNSTAAAGRISVGGPSSRHSEGSGVIRPSANSAFSMPSTSSAAARDEMMGEEAFDFDSVLDNEPTADDDSVALPAKSINQIIKDTLVDTRISVDCRDAVHSCCISFIRELSRNAQRFSVQDQRKTITHEHVIQALQAMGFPPAYRDAADSVLAECQEHAHRRLKRKHSRLENCGIPEEELLRQQQMLFEQARLQQQALDETGLAEYREQLQLQQQQEQSGGPDDGDPDGPAAKVPGLAANGQVVATPSATSHIELDDDYDAD